jgi:hypothetical protein
VQQAGLCAGLLQKALRHHRFAAPAAARPHFRYTIAS